MVAEIEMAAEEAIDGDTTGGGFGARGHCRGGWPFSVEGEADKVDTDGVHGCDAGNAIVVPEGAAIELGADEDGRGQGGGLGLGHLEGEELGDVGVSADSLI